VRGNVHERLRATEAIRARLATELATLRAENARLRELMQAAIAWQATIRPDKADRTANISKEERALFFAVEETRAAIPAQGQAQGEAVEVAVWGEDEGGELRLCPPNSRAEATFRASGWMRRLGTTLLPIRATVEGGGE
jgi:hypothetical protein